MCAGLFDCENVRESVVIIDAHIREVFKDNNRMTYKKKSGENLSACFCLHESCFALCNRSSDVADSADNSHRECAHKVSATQDAAANPLQD
jgi:hypothetical protein